MRGLSNRPVLSGAQPADDVQALAYTCLEEARLRLECLDSCLSHRPHLQAQPDLRACHRHLGLAGFHCCAELPSSERLQRLAFAHDRLRTDERDPVKGSLDAIVRATDAVEHALIAGNLAGHIQTAHGHVLAACDSFGAYLRITGVGIGPGRE